MRTLSLAVATIILFAFSHPASAAIDRLQKQDFPRFAIYMLRLYYNIGKSTLDYTKTCITSLPDLPKAVYYGVLQGGRKGEPRGYYMTRKERREYERQKRLERLEEKRKKAEEEETSLTAIKE